MLPRKHRLPSSVDQLTQPQAVSNDSYTLLYTHNHRSHARARIVASKKLLPKAVDRNQLKRQLSSIISQQEVLSRPLDLIIIPKPSITTQSYNAKRQQLIVLLHQLNE